MTKQNNLVEYSMMLAAREKECRRALMNDEVARLMGPAGVVTPLFSLFDHATQLSELMRNHPSRFDAQGASLVCTACAVI